MGLATETGMVLVDLTCAFAILLVTPTGAVDSTGDWYGVERAVDSGDEASSLGRQFSRLLSDDLDGEVELVDMSEVLEDDGATVTRTLEMVLVNEADEEIVRAELDDDGAIVRVEALRRPRSEAQRRYRYTQQLRNSVNGKAVSDMTLVRDDMENLVRVQMTLEGGERVAIDMTDFDATDSGCGG